MINQWVSGVYMPEAVINAQLCALALHPPTLFLLRHGEADKG